MTKVKLIKHQKNAKRAQTCFPPPKKQLLHVLFCITLYYRICIPSFPKATSPKQYTLPETNSSHLKMDGWNTIVSYIWEFTYFQGLYMLVLGRVYHLLHQELPQDGLSWPLLVKEKRRLQRPETGEAVAEGAVFLGWDRFFTGKTETRWA